MYKKKVFLTAKEIEFIQEALCCHESNCHDYAKELAESNESGINTSQINYMLGRAAECDRLWNILHEIKEGLNPL